MYQCSLLSKRQVDPWFIRMDLLRRIYKTKILNLGFHLSSSSGFIFHLLLISSFIVSRSESRCGEATSDALKWWKLKLKTKLSESHRETFFTFAIAWVCKNFQRIPIPLSPILKSPPSFTSNRCLRSTKFTFPQNSPVADLNLYFWHH